MIESTEDKNFLVLQPAVTSKFSETAVDGTQRFREEIPDWLRSCGEERANGSIVLDKGQRAQAILLCHGAGERDYITERTERRPGQRWDTPRSMLHSSTVYALKDNEDNKSNVSFGIRTARDTDEKITLRQIDLVVFALD